MVIFNLLFYPRQYNTYFKEWLNNYELYSVLYLDLCPSLCMLGQTEKTGGKAFWACGVLNTFLLGHLLGMDESVSLFSPTFHFLFVKFISDCMYV